MYIARLFHQSDPDRPIDARMIAAGIMRIGRDPGCDWVIDDADREISRTHCQLRVSAEALYLQAIGANGVFDEANQRLPENVDVCLDSPGMFRFGKFRIQTERAPEVDLSSADACRTQIAIAPLGETSAVPDQWAEGGAPSSVSGDGSLLEAFCRGAGLDASMLSSEDPEEIMFRVGGVYRQMVLGVGDLMAERDKARSRHRMTLTTIAGGNNNPFKWAPTQRLAIDLILASDKGFMSGPQAIKASFEDIKRHLIASFAGFRASLKAAVDRFEPGSIAGAASKRGGLLKGHNAQIVEEATERHAALAEEIGDGRSGALGEVFVQAYNATSAKPEGIG